MMQMLLCQVIPTTTRKNKNPLLDTIKVAGVLVKRECRTKKATVKLALCLLKPQNRGTYDSTAVAERSLHFGSTVELHLSGHWLSGSPIIRIGLALRRNLSKI